MTTRKLYIVLITAVTVMASATASYADISNAAVLFLRIAPGARAAGMGEAFVAIADDATATHWNPAGLGAYPLADTWVEVKVPAHLQPLKNIATFRNEGGQEYQKYDIWAITPQGLARYDHRRWHLGEIFSLRTDQTVAGVVKSYFGIEDEELLANMVAAVAQANSAMTPTALEELRDSVLAVVPADYDDTESLRIGFDSLLAVYEQCLINWENVSEITRLLQAGLRDSVLIETEVERINIAVERSQNRFVPEELTIPYSALFGDNLTALVSSEDALMVGTNDGLYVFNGRRWRSLSMADDLPSHNILCLHATGSGIYIGTDHGLARFAGQQVVPISGGDLLPDGAVTAIGASGSSDLWIALDQDLYHFDGKTWTNYFEYTVALDDTPEKIAEKFSLYGSLIEQEQFVEKFHLLNQQRTEDTAGVAVAVDSTSVGDLPEADSAVVEVESENVVETTPEAAIPDSDTPDSAGPSVAEVDSADVADTAPEPVIEESDTAAFADTATAGIEAAVVPLEPGDLTPGSVVRVPYVAEIKGRVDAIYPAHTKVWFGTELGLLVFDRDRWFTPGYREYIVEDGQTLSDLVGMKRHRDSTSARQFADRIKAINDLPQQPLAAGRTVKIPRNPIATPVRAISGTRDRVYFSTADGLVKFDQDGWSHVYQYGMDRTSAVQVISHDDGLWAAGNDKVVIKANGRAEIAFMYAKWLPELADDLYYGFASVAINSGNWGTFGGNITYISYGRFARTLNSPEVVGEFESFDVSMSGSYGTALTSKLKGGISAKVIYSRLTDQGAGREQGQGTSTGFAIDVGLLYQMNLRFNCGLALTNLGPKMAYIDAAQADDLPRNLSLGFSYKLLQSDYYYVLFASEVNKLMVGLGDGISEELKQVTFNTGWEVMYANTIAGRVGYIHDEEGKLKTFTFGVGLYMKNVFKFDFGYYFGSDVNESRKGIKPLTFSVIIP
ncbi:MAG: PorV/PorQ family protein [bacterium]